MEENKIEHISGRGGITATILSFIPTSIFLQVDSSNLHPHLNASGYDKLIVAGIISVIANLLIKLTDRFLLWIYGYKIGDYFVSKFFKSIKKNNT